MQILGLIIIGIVIGILARLVLPGGSASEWMTILLGIAGALVGGIVASAIGEGDIWELNFIGTVVGVVGRVLHRRSGCRGPEGLRREAPDRRRSAEPA